MKKHLMKLKNGDRYLSDLEIDIEEGSRTLIKAPTDSGKTTFALADDSHEYTIVLVPKISIGLSKEESTNIPFFFDGKRADTRYCKKWLATYDNIETTPKEVLNKAIVYIDEVHLLGMSAYREKLPQVIQYLFENAKTVVGLSGTLNEEVFEEIFDTLIDIKRENVKSIIINNVECNMTPVSFAVLHTLEAVYADKKALVLIENIQQLETFEQELRTYKEFADWEDSILRYVSEESRLTVKNRPEAVYAVSKGVLSAETMVLCGTSAIVEGWDLKDDDDWVVIVAGETNNHIKTPEVLIQLASRIRNLNPITVYVQRNEVQTQGNYEVLEDFEIWQKIRYQYKKAKEQYLSTGKLDIKYLSKLDDVLIENDVPLFEMRQSNINKKYAYSDYDAYVKHCLKLGAFDVIQTKRKTELKIKPFGSIEEATLAVIQENPRQEVVTDFLVDMYLKEENVLNDTGELVRVQLPKSVERYIETCKILQLKARERIKELMRVLRWYKHDFLLDNIQIKADGTMKFKKAISTLNKHINQLIEHQIERYKVTTHIVAQLDGKDFTIKELEKVVSKIPDKYFGGKANSYKYKKDAKKFVSLIKSKTVNGTRYFRIDYETPFYEEYVNSKIRERIIRELEHRIGMNKKRKLEKFKGVEMLRQDFANYVDMFAEVA